MKWKPYLKKDNSTRRTRLNYQINFDRTLRNEILQDYFLRWFAHCGTNSGSSQVNVDSSRTFPSPQEIKRGKPLTQVMSLWQSPGTANLGYGQNLAETVWEGTFVGHLNPTTAENNGFYYCNLENFVNSLYS